LADSPILREKVGSRSNADHEVSGTPTNRNTYASNPEHRIEMFSL